MEKIYLAGFDVFYPDAKERFERMKTLCRIAGYEPLVPLDNEITEGLDIAGKIYRVNIDMIENANGIIANLNPFRGTEPDSGTVFEVGYGVAKGKKIVGYTDIKDWKTHVAGNVNTTLIRGGALFDSMFSGKPQEKFTIEDFGLPLNLMLSKSIHVITGDFIDALDKYKSLELEAERVLNNHVIDCC